MKLKKSFKILMEEDFSGEEAKRFVSEIALHHRIPGGFGFHETVEYVRWMLKNLGLEVTIDTRPLDGAFKIWTWSFPLAWDITSASLSVVEPEPESITTFEETATSVYKRSAATPPEGVTAELVFVGNGTDEADYAGKDVTGKVVLARGGGEEVAELAVRKYGALGVVTDLLRPHPPVKTRLGTPDLVQDSSLRATDKRIWAFSISYSQFKRLKELLDRGLVKVNAKINAFFVEPGTLETVVAKIPGSDISQEEVIVISHLCHYRPGANDNASGVGLAMETAKVIQEAIKSGVIDRPRRTITFIVGAEMYGSISYLERNWGRRQSLVGGFCLDMVGEDQEKTKAGVEVSSVPDSLPTFLNDHVATLLEEVRRRTLYTMTTANRAYKYDSLTVTFRYNVSQFSPGSDHLIFDDSSVGIPVIQFGHWPDVYYHSSGDTVEMVDPAELKRNGLVLGTALLNLANAGAEQAVSFMNHVETQSKKRIADNGGRVRDEVISLYEEWKRSGEEPAKLVESVQELLCLEFRCLDFLVSRDIEGLRSVLRLVKSESVAMTSKLESLATVLSTALQEGLAKEKDAIESLAASLLSIEGQELKLEAKVVRAEFERTVPKRKYVGPLASGEFRQKLSLEKRKRYDEWSKQDVKFNAKMVEAWSFANGKRSIAEIADAVSFEYGTIAPETMLELFKDLEEHGYVELK
jgi:hypothetical protein